MCTRKWYEVYIEDYAGGMAIKMFICKKEKGAYVRRSFSTNDLDSKKSVRLCLPRCHRSYTG